MEPLQNDSLSEKAAECFLSLEVGASDQLTRLRWRLWLAESREHRRAFEAYRAVWQASASAKATQPAETGLARDRYDGETPVSTFLAQTARPAGNDIAHQRLPRIPRSAWMGMAASLLLAAIFFAQRHTTTQPGEPPAPVAYETGRGEERQLTLPDGSVVVMGPQVRLEVELLPAQRIFRLIRGEAIFTAAHDAARPFRVYAGAGWIDDIGTAFDVRSDPDRVTVTVIQGEVEVDMQAAGRSAPTRLSRDQQVSFGKTQGPVHAVDAKQATGWRDGQLAYIDQPLEDVVADLQRYSMKDIVMQDPSVRALRYTGTVSVGELDHWAAGLARVYPVQITTESDRLVIAAKRKP